MTTYLIKRFFIMLFTIFVVSILAFAVIQLPPGDYVSTMVNQMIGSGAKVPPDMEMRLRETYGLDQPMVVQYGKWLRNIVTEGQFGYSYTFRRDAFDIIRDRFPLTFIISLSTIIFVWLVALPIGVYSAVKKYSAGDYAVSFIGFLGLATPDFLLALIFLYLSYVFGGQALIGLFSTEYANAPWSWAKLWDLMQHMWIPVIIIGTAGTAGLIRTMRANLLDELNKPYVETARAKGMSEWRLIWKYPVREALNPFVSTLGWALPALISGEILVAIVLNLPTSGPILLGALENQDLYLASGFILLLSILTVIGTFLSDLALAWLDPRIRLE